MGDNAVLLRSITKHINDQNWFAVGIDFAIVVIGVFIGIQVANWNQNNADHQEERLILERLFDQLSYTEVRRDEVEDYGYANLTALSSAREVLFGIIERNALTPQECNAIGYSSLFFNFSDSIPILQELGSSGKFSLIRNQSVVTALANLSNATKAEAEIISETRKFRVALAAQFPDLIVAGLTPDKQSENFEEIGSYDITFSCDLEKMRMDRAFLNALAYNSGYSFVIFELGTLPKIKALQDLKIAVESAL